MRGHRAGAPHLGAGAIAALLCVLTLACVGWPAVGVAFKVFAARETVGSHHAIPAWNLLATTAGWAVGIGALATILAWPAGWWLRERGWGGLPLLCVSLLLPAYLAYSGYGLLRAPRSWLGDLVEESARDWPGLPVLVDRAIAVLAMSLWAWPIAAVVLATGLRRLDQGALEALRLERTGYFGRLWQRVRMTRGTLAMAGAAVAVVMLGSAVPLHLAQAPTYSMRIWYDLTLAPGSAAVWVSAWPLLAVAAAGGWWVSAAVVRGDGGGLFHPARRRRQSVWVWGLLALSVGVPGAMFAFKLRSWASIGEFFTISGEALAASAGLAAVVAVVACSITGAVWLGLSGEGGARRTVTAWCVRAFFVAGFTPGVLVGLAVAHAAASVPGMSESAVMVVVAHVARFGCIPALVGCWLAAAEPRELRDVRRTEGATGLFAWLGGQLPVHMGAVAAAGLVCGAMSLHEIEAAVVIQPPGSTSLAQEILGYLHYLRMEELSAAAVVLVGIGLAAALLVRAATAAGGER